jgi:S1-C subfamily serine protease
LLHGDREFAGRLLASDESNFLSLLQVDGLDIPTLTVTGERPRFRDEVFMIGQDRDVGLIVSTGTVIGLDAFSGDSGPFIAVDMVVSGQARPAPRRSIGIVESSEWSPCETMT